MTELRPQKLVTTAFGELLVGQLYPQFQGSFEYTVDNTELNSNTLTNGGTITQSEAMCVASTSTTTGSKALFQSKQHATYRAGLGGLNRFTALFTTPVAGTEQFIGIAEDRGVSANFKNGYMIGFDGTTFGFHRFQNDTQFTIAIADWDDPLDGTGASGMTIDLTKLNVFGIRFQYLGAGAIEICVEDDSTGKFIVAHTLLYANANTTPSTHMPHFKHTQYVDNGSTTNDIVLKSSSYAYFIEGKTSFIELHQPQFPSSTITKNTVTTEIALFTIKSKATYSGKTNFIDSLLELVSASVEASSANNLATIRLIRGATLGGTPSFVDINTTNSVMSIDTVGTTVTGGDELFSFPLAGKNDKEVIQLLSLKELINPEETLTLAVSSVNSATIKGSLLWKELF